MKRKTIAAVGVYSFESKIASPPGAKFKMEKRLRFNFKRVKDQKKLVHTLDTFQEQYLDTYITS